MITLADISSALTRVLPRYDVREAYLFGSFARGEQTPDSDIDLRLACGDSMTFGALYQLSLDLEDELGRKVDIVTNPPQHMHPTFRKNIKQDEERLYEMVPMLMINFKYAIVTEELKHMLYALQDPALAHDNEKCDSLMKRFNELKTVQSIMAKRLGDRVVLR